MASSCCCFFPPPLRLLKSSSSSSSANYHRTKSLTLIANSSSSDNNDTDAKNAKPAFNPFGFVTDNPSSRNAIQLPEVPAEDGNVGQMLYRIEDKGRDFGRSVKSGEFRWFVRETGTPESYRGTVVFLHGAPAQSYSYRVVMSEMSDLGFHCIAPDWIGFGFSEKPQPGYGFDYTGICMDKSFVQQLGKLQSKQHMAYMFDGSTISEKEFHEEFDRLLGVLGVTTPFKLVVQGFLVGSYGLTWALKNQSRISSIAIMNTPLTTSSPVPGLFQQLRIPLFGEFTCQNAVMAERFIEAGSAYVLKLEKADVYRLPYLKSSGPGFALLEAARKANFKETASQVAAGFASGSWDKPTLVAWGIADKYLPQSVAEEFQKGNPGNIKLKFIEGAGHMPQEDWPEKVVEALRMFF